MFASFRRHKWLWGVIFGLTILSFVWFFTPQAQRGGGYTGSGKEPVGSINGVAVTRDDYLNAYRESELQFFFNYGRWASEDQQARQLKFIERQTRNRLFMIRKIEALNIQAAEGATAQWIADAFRDPEEKVFRKDNYDGFVNNTLTQRGFRKADFDRFVRHEIAMEHLVALAGITGKLVPPQEAELRYNRENEEVKTKAAFLWSSNYLDSVTMDPVAIATYYTNQQATYRIPERVQVNYVRFVATNYLDLAQTAMASNTNLTEIIDATYLQRGTNSFFGDNNQPLTAELAKDQIRKEILDQYALVEARKKAIDFANELIEMDPKTNNLVNLAAAKGIPSQVTLPFTQFSRPPELSVPDTFTTAAFQLSPEEPVYEQPIVASDSVYMIGYHARIPSEVPPLESVRLRVTEDYKRSKASDLVNSAGSVIREAIASAIAGGKTFDEACAEQKLTPVDLAPFSQKSQMVFGIPGSGNLPALKNAAFALKEGEISQFTPTREGGFVVLLESKKQPDPEKTKEALPEYLATLQRNQQNQAFSAWLGKEMAASTIVLPNDPDASESAN
ncbi:MAG: SurA N-terminal domain-containing protein [Verrucomicrobia bacterium]|jgi:hypothetical protein|nr:SurA N-terminal domain-containing protein [Verrucomicrobiota bacterium]